MYEIKLYTGKYVNDMLNDLYIIHENNILCLQFWFDYVDNVPELQCVSYHHFTLIFEGNQVKKFSQVDNPP